MNSTLYNGYSGIKTHQFGLDSISNNIANINTTGYRANVPEFKSIFSNALNSANPASPVSSDMNYGSSVAANAISNISGSYKESDGELNVAYVGKGWLVVGDNENETFNTQEPNANAYFTRDGSFSRDAEGYIVNSSGYYMMGVDLGKIKDGIFISNPENDGTELAISEVKPLQIPQDLHYGPTETTKVELAVNLNSNQAILPAYELFTSEDGKVDEEQLLNEDINSFLVDNENINATAYNNGIIKITRNGETKEYNFNYGNEGENSFKTLGELINLIKEQTNLDFGLSRDVNGDIDKNITLELKNTTLNDVEVELDGKLFDRLGLKGKKNLDTLKIEAYNPAKTYNINDLVSLDGAIFKKIQNDGNLSPLEDDNSWVIVDSSNVKEYNPESNYGLNDLVYYDGKIFQKTSEIAGSNPMDDEANWKEIGDNVAINIEQFTPENEYTKNSFVYFNNNIYVKIGDSSSGTPDNDTLNWKIINSEKFLSNKINIANYKTTTEFFDENGDKLLIISEFILQDNSNLSKTWNIKSAIYDKDGKTAISPIVEHSITFDNEGKVIEGDEVELQMGDKNIAYNVLGAQNKQSTNLSYMDSSILETTKDGTQKGELVNIGVDNNGIINLSFSNGITEPMGRVGVVAFVNDQGLQKIGGNLFQMTSLSVDDGKSVISSGAPIIGWDESGNLRFGQMLHKYLETSNVNAADAMTDLIVFQRGYAMNAKAFTTGDDLIKEAINLKR
ncbi:hypothetical protein CCY99_08825 [Helicobacter sp. 16-1353]|uniref:flagellar hook-basal body complex protein n=1 Tax=Helicobacter sp. 16-1353 TaxID=2004996 RepID=UPI000DCF4AF2|nr:flagellar hook-basal body complex protein [Helicobacter sp. 16-1353]RAX51555.1 hypothetical protein CCY99_08825 [Helicobacter sp. 16-1353]